MKTTKEQRDAWRNGEGRPAGVSPNNTNFIFLPPTLMEAVLDDLDTALADAEALRVALKEVTDAFTNFAGRRRHVGGALALGDDRAR